MNSGHSIKANPGQWSYVFASLIGMIALMLFGSLNNPNIAFADITATGTTAISRTSTDALLNPQQVTATGESVTHHTAGTCDWYIDENGCLTIQPLDDSSIGILPNWEYCPPWYGVRTQIKSVIFNGNIKATTCRYMFDGCSSLESANLTGLDALDASSAYMFAGCSSLISVDTSNTSLPGYQHMFDGCTSLRSVDLPGAYLHCPDYMF